MFNKTKIKDTASGGFKDVLYSFSFVSENKSLIKYYIIPFLLNLIILSAIFYFSYNSLNPWLQGLTAGDAWYMKALSMIISPVLFVILLITTIFLYTILGTIIASPFLDFLSSKTEEIYSGISPDADLSLTESIKDIIRTTKNALKLLVLLLFLNLALLFLNFIPGGAFIYAFLNFFFTAFFYGFQFFDYPLEKRFYSFREKLRICWRFKRTLSGNGTAFFLMSFIPAIGFLGLNSATVGAAISFKKYIEPALVKKGPQ
jgi:CysZ protein